MKNLGSQRIRAFTLIEMLVVVAILAIIIGIAVAALSTSKRDSTITAQRADAKVLNEALLRASLKQDSVVASALEGGDAATVVAALASQGYIQ